MTLAVMLAAGILTTSPGSPASPPPHASRAAYEAERDRAGADADSQIRLALWCEAHGLPAERLKHLALACLRDPKNTAARGLMGVVRFRDRWASPEKVASQLSDDAAYTATLAAYRERRAKAPQSAEGQARLAQWCEENGLIDESKAHHAIALRFDPNRELSRRKLGFKRDGRRWVTDAQLLAEKEEARLQGEADQKWKASLLDARARLNDREKRAQASEDLANVTDPRAVRSVLAVFARGDEADRGLAVRLLGQIDAAASSQALAWFAVLDGSAEIRRAAAETLKRRDPREYAGLLIGLIRRPLRYEVRPVGGPGSPGALFVEGEQAINQRYYAPPSASFPIQVGDFLTYDDYGLPILKRSGPSSLITKRYTGSAVLKMIEDGTLPLPQLADSGELARRLDVAGFAPIGQYIRQNGIQRQAALDARAPAELAKVVRATAEAEKLTPDEFGFAMYRSSPYETIIPIGQLMEQARTAAVVSQRQLEADVASLDEQNARIKSDNDLVLGLLRSAAGKDLGTDPEGWKAWYVDQLGYRYQSPGELPKPTYVETIPSAYTPPPVVVYTQVRPQETYWDRLSCFGAGTLVRTLQGSAPIETLSIGDRVLTQSVADGSLSYQPITRVYHNPPSATFLVKVAGDTIVSSPFHRFWVAGKGWVMARDLEGGEVLRLLDGTRRVDSVEAGPEQPVFNLDVAGDHDFFAGKAAALVHDNSLPDTRLAPFDAASALADPRQ
ncbi:polymorphic toxin-type HINT domain-containing protein [Tundrisphaera sp. TA3]|uniref:polymorphic toxin-type HINT domain-containing protein n=1 Tax=Tundrisphaera sp. TA3 TaxID=3435775 RepID=UPI003EB92EE0